MSMSMKTNIIHVYLYINQYPWRIEYTVRCSKIIIIQIKQEMS